MASVEKTTEQIERQVVLTEDVETFTLTLDAREAQVLRAVLGNLHGGYADSVRKGEVRTTVDGIWEALLEAGVPASSNPYSEFEQPRLRDEKAAEIPF